MQEKGDGSLPTVIPMDDKLMKDVGSNVFDIENAADNQTQDSCSCSTWSEAVPVGLLAVLVGIVQLTLSFTGNTTYQRVFMEMDPMLSFPFVPADQQIVPMGLMVVIAVVFPCIAIFAAQTLVRYCLLKTDESSICDIFRDVGNEYRSNIREATAFLKAQFFLGQSLLLNMFLTNVLKYWVRRPRPNFFAFCNYKGYRNALETNNFAAYLSKTAVTTMGKVADCTSTESDIHEAQLSWPSGHSSSGMTGLLATALIFTVCINAAVDMGQLKNLWLTKTMKVFAIAIPVLGAFLVGATRVKDYWHNFDDVLSGLFIGMFCTLACFYNMYISPNINGRKNA